MKLVVCLALALTTAAPAFGGIFSVRDYGAKGDRRTNDRAAIQSAIDACVSTGGGVVRFPAGAYLSGQLNLGSGVTLQLDRGATLCASRSAKDYSGGRHDGALLMAEKAVGIAVKGQGIIDGQANGDYGKRWGVPNEPEFRTNLISFRNCRRVSISDVAFHNSDSWTIVLTRCDHVVIQGVTIRNNYRRLNSDGIDPDSCTDVRINRCDILTGDDSIVLKTGRDFPCSDVEVTDCTLESATCALKLGTGSYGDYRSIRFADCRIKNSPVGVGLYMKDGATMDGITADHITMQMSSPDTHDVVPLFIDIEKRDPDSRIGTVRNVTFSNIAIAGGSGLLLQGMPESPIQNLVLRNIAFHVTTPDDYQKRKKPIGGTRTNKDERDTLYARKPTYGAVAYVKGLTVENFQVAIAAPDLQRFPRSALAGFHIDGGTIAGVTRTVGHSPPVELNDCSGVTVAR
jgi:hypothetical protein